MQLESIRVALRPRTVWEGCDLGVRLLQASHRTVYRNHLLVMLPLSALLLATVEIADWLPMLLLWLCKPWLDRTLLFCLSRALFGEETRAADLWAAARSVWGGQWLRTFTLARLSASRAFTAPVVQLEGLAGRDLRKRLDVLATRRRGTARLMTQMFATAELSIYLSLLIVPAWLTPTAVATTWSMASITHVGPFLAALAYVLAVFFVEPFYVAAGFGMYINRRVELEAWDVEQEFRRAFAA